MLRVWTGGLDRRMLGTTLPGMGTFFTLELFKVLPLSIGTGCGVMLGALPEGRNMSAVAFYSPLFGLQLSIL